MKFFYLLFLISVSCATNHKPEKTDIVFVNYVSYNNAYKYDNKLTKAGSEEAENTRKLPSETVYQRNERIRQENIKLAK